MIKIMDEHAWVDDKIIHAQLKLNDNDKRIDIDAMLHLMEDGSEEIHFAVEKIAKEASGQCEEDKNEIYGQYEEDKYETSEKYNSYEEALESVYADYIAIAKRMLDECSCRVQRVQYEVVSRDSRLIDNFYEKIPEAEMEISFRDGSHLFLFAYETAVYVEYAISKVSWFAQENTSNIDRENDIIESYDSFQECLTSQYPELFYELKELIDNEIKLAMEQMSENDEEEEEEEY